MSTDAVPSGSDLYFAFVCAVDVFWFCNYLKIDFLKDNTTKRVLVVLGCQGSLALLQCLFDFSRNMKKKSITINNTTPFQEQAAFLPKVK